MKLIRACLFLFCVVPVVSAQDKANPCLSYEPKVEVLKGKIIRKTIAGSPNYENIRAGDRPETYWLMELNAPICVNEDKSPDSINGRHEDVSLVQLVFVNPSDYKKYRTLVGQEVLATGTLFDAHTGHHHTPVLMTVNRLEEQSSK